MIDKNEVFGTTSHADVLTTLSKHNLDYMVQEYFEYLNERAEELEPDESPGIILQSLQSWVWFTLSYAIPKEIPCVKIRADFVGCAKLLWRLSEYSIPNDPDNEYYGNGRGILSLRFYPSRLNHISVLTGAFAMEKRRISFDGFFSHATTGPVMDIFKDRLLSPNS